MSTLKANIITAVGGGGSTVKVNNDSTYISDGGAVTDSNLVQSLIKAFCRFDGTSSGLLDSFNHGTLTDHGTGDHSITYTNSMANSNHTVTYLIGHNGGTGMLRLGNRDIATTGHGLVGTNPAQDSAQDMNRSGSMVTGDLA